MHRDRGLSFWDFVPVVGSVRNLKHSSEDFSDGNNIQGLLNLGLGVGGLALDVMTFGSASLLRDGIKIGVKKGAEKIIITKSAEIGLKVLGTTTAGYAVKSVASPVINGTCDVVREEFNNYNRNSNGRSNRNNNDNTKKESSNDRKTTNTESSGANASNTKSSNNSGSNSNNNNNNNNNNPRKNSGTNTTQNRRDETLAWFKSLQITGIDANRIQDHELDRLAKVRIEMMTYENDNAGFMDRAVVFARVMRPTSVSRFCSFVNLFAIRFSSERDTQMQKVLFGPLFAQEGLKKQDPMTPPDHYAHQTYIFAVSWESNKDFPAPYATKSAEIGLKVLGTTTAGYAVKSVASPVINGTCDVVREEFNSYNRNSNGRNNRNNNDNTKKESSNDRKTTNTESSGANTSNTKSSNNSGSNSNNNNNNNNNNARKNSLIRHRTDEMKHLHGSRVCKSRALTPIEYKTMN